MKINTPNIKTFNDCQRMFNNIKNELSTYEKENNNIEIDYGMWSFPGNPLTTGISAGDRIPNDYVLDEGSGTITTNLDYTYNLKANKIYELNASIVCSYSSVDGFCRYRFFDEEAGKHIGASPYTRPLTYTSNLSSTEQAKAFLRTKRDQKISLRIQHSTYLSGLYGSNGAYAFISILEIGRV
jgi:hypothetical protein